MEIQEDSKRKRYPNKNWTLWKHSCNDTDDNVSYGYSVMLRFDGRNSPKHLVGSRCPRDCNSRMLDLGTNRFMGSVVIVCGLG